VTLIEKDIAKALAEKGRDSLLSQIPLGRTGTAADVAALAVFLASDASASITGQVIQVDAGLSM
jgi:3-oxoacyl-[acyl-carrier protein] reductase